MKSYSQLGIWARGILITVAAVLAYLVSDPTFQKITPAEWRMITGAALVAVIAIRGFIDQSPAKGEGQAPVPVTAKEPLPVTETAPTAPIGAEPTEKEPDE